MAHQTNWKNKIFFGVNKKTGERIYLDAPAWSCNWYWSFGYLGNRNCHYHLANYQSQNLWFKLEDGSYKVLTEKRNKNMHDCLLEDYDLNPKIKDNLWKFCELALTAYSLKKSAEVLGRGGSHVDYNPCADLIQNQDEVKRINEIVLPAIFDKIIEIIG